MSEIMNFTTSDEDITETLTCPFVNITSEDFPLLGKVKDFISDTTIMNPDSLSITTNDKSSKVIFTLDVYNKSFASNKYYVFSKNEVTLNKIHGLEGSYVVFENAVITINADLRNLCSSNDTYVFFVNCTIRLSPEEIDDKIVTSGNYLFFFCSFVMPVESAKSIQYSGQLHLVTCFVEVGSSLTGPLFCPDQDSSTYISACRIQYLYSDDTENYTTTFFSSPYQQQELEISSTTIVSKAENFKIIDSYVKNFVLIFNDFQCGLVQIPEEFSFGITERNKDSNLNFLNPSKYVDKGLPETECYGRQEANRKHMSLLESKIANQVS